MQPPLPLIDELEVPAPGALPANLGLGTCGFSYREWVGPFYPPGTRASDMLGFYARHFNCVEIDASYYAIPTAATTLRFVAKTPPEFQFIMKAHQSMTHELDSTRRVFEEFRRCLHPLLETGRLACVLAQFPQRFHRKDENLAYLREFRERMTDLCVVVEFRHVSWNCPETFALLDELGLHFCSVDAPRLPGLVPDLRLRTGDRCRHGPLTYGRFHGRNARQWHRHREAWMRYDYLYTEEELEPWARWLQAEAAAPERKVFALFNNHAQAKAVVDARRLRRRLHQAVSLEESTSANAPASVR